MKKAFADPTLEPVLFGFDVIITSGGGAEESIDKELDPDANDDVYD